MKLLAHIPFCLLTLLLLIIGFNTYTDYGSPWDEYMQREMGRFNYNYITSENDSLLNWRCRDYGVVVELPLYVLEKKFTHERYADTVFMRHLACFILFVVGVVFFYLVLIKLKFKPLLAFCGVLMLVVSPRIYGHAFINSKDIPLMVYYIIAFYTLLRLIKKPNSKNVIIHAFTCALLIDTRITGIIMVPASILFYILSVYQKSEHAVWHIIKFEARKTLLLFLIFNAVFVYIMWPYLWLNPIKNFVIAFLDMSQFPWKGLSLLFGEFIPSSETPWYFGFLWFIITTPVIYLALGLIGILCLFGNLFKASSNIFKSQAFIEMLMPFGLFAGPIFATILFKSVLYDTWRHLYFIYPFFIMMACYGASFLLSKIKTNALQYVCVIPLLFYIGLLAHQMTKSFPHEYVYFNECIKSSDSYLRENFDLDYWGLSFRKGLEKILEKDTSDTIKITGNVFPYYSNYLLLTHMNQNCRLKYVLHEHEADYYLTNYRYNPKDHINHKDKEIYTIKYKNSEILGVYKVR